jgi:PKD repeat protein
VTPYDSPTWAWNFGDGSTSTLHNPTHTYTTAGTYTANLTVTSGSYTDTDTAQVTINNPTSGITVDAHGPYNGYTNTAIQFTGSATGGTTYSWSWNFGDGGTSTSQNPTHTYTSTGTKTVTLTVTSGSNTSSDTTTVSVNTKILSTVHEPPTADAGGPYNASINQIITFDASASTDPYDSITGYRWDWTNDGIYDTNWSSNSTATHIYTTAGTYTVNLQVKDNLGAAVNDTALVTISQGNIILKADAGGPYYDTIGISIEFDGSGSYNLNATNLTYKWSFGDGNTSTSIIPTHTYYKDGNYTIILTVTDDDNNTYTYTTYIIITKKTTHPPETPTISGIISSYIYTNCNY